MFKKSPFRFRSPIRLSVLVVTSAIALALATAGGLAQKSRKISGPTRSISGGSESRNNKTTRGSNRNNKALNRTTSGSNVQDPITGVTVGVPDVGERGIERTTAEIMQAQQVAPPSSRPHVAPEREVPGREDRPQSPNALPQASWPDVGAAAAPGMAIHGAVTPSAPQTLGTQFTGATLADTGAFPPDTMGAVGPTQFFVHVNGRVRTFNKTTGVADGVVNADSDVFFLPVMSPFPGGGLNFTTDPNVRYDRLSARWFLTIIDVPSTSPASIGDIPNRILIAVSDAASAGVLSGATVWTFFFVQQDTVGPVASTGEFLDYPSLGIDVNALYIGGNMFGAVSGSFIGCSVFVIRKTSALSGGPIVTTAFRGVVVGAGDGPFAPRGVDNYDPAATEGYFIGISNAAFSRVNMRRVGTPGGTPTISADIPINTPLTTTFPENVQHLGNTGGTAGRLDALDDRLFAAHIRNQRLWTAHNIEVNASGVASGAGSRDAARWYELNVPVGVGTPTFVQSGTTFDPAATNPRYFWIPSVMVSGQGHAAFGFSSAGLNDRVNASTNGRLTGDGLGTTQAINTYTASVTAYNPPSDPGPGRRWGDYSYTSLDPLDDMTMWTMQEFCDATNTYGVRAVQLIAPPPATPSSVVTGETLNTTVPQGRNNYFVTVNGTASAGSGFYDPGANLAPPALPFNHVNVTINGAGAPTVNPGSITFISPTQLTIRINTLAASVGSYTITVTNPDGQALASVPALLTVVGPTAAPATISGRITTSDGAPLGGVTMNLGGARSAKTITDANGNYRFVGADTDKFYTVTPALVSYHFSPGTQSFSLLANKTDAGFTGTRDVIIGGNAIDSAEYFVRQHYLDFLGREPDESGFNFWSDQMLSCGSDAGCLERRRINVSAAYFLSIEFQQTGGLVDGLYRASYGRRPMYAEFMPDTATVAQNVIVGNRDWTGQLAANKEAFINAWVERPAFRAAYDGLANDAFVDSLINHTGVSFTAGDRAALVNGLSSGALTRAAALRQIVENEEFVAAKRNQAFVMMQYFGYLRRDPDESGYQFWLNKLNQFDGNFERAEMVKAFIVSGEYRQRFGQ